MSEITVTPSSLCGSVQAPPSKSQTMRAILFATMAHGTSRVRHYLRSPDVEAMLQAVQRLGAEVRRKDDEVCIVGVSGQVNVRPGLIDAGNSGQVLRFIPAFAALSNQPIQVTGDESVRTRRPVLPLLDGLTQLGAVCKSTHGYAPIDVCGPIHAASIEIDGQDSQPVSGLIMATAFLSAPSTIRVRNPGEKPWVGLTLSWLDRLGIDYQNQDFQTYRIAGQACYPGFDYVVPGDFSSMAYPIVAALITGSTVRIEGVDMQDAQGDKKLIGVLQAMGADIDFDPARSLLSVRGGVELIGCEVDINDMIDAVTILAVVGCYAKGVTRLMGAAVARQKECNRIASIVCELKKMGADIDETADGLVVRHSPLQGSKTLQCYQDHRMAMSLTVAALGAKGESAIAGVECVQKSYPDFFSQMQGLGAELEFHFSWV